MTHHHFNPVILRAYDIRGIMGESLFSEDAAALGRVFAAYTAKECGKPASALRVVIARDGRLSSPELSKALIAGLQAAGVSVTDAGIGPTPMLYFATQHEGFDGGIMITGSHNPPTHNGFKMVCNGAALFGEQIQTLGTMAATGQFPAGNGTTATHSYHAEYLAALLTGYTATRGLKVAWDAGNGATGEIMQRLAAALPGTHILLNEAIDGTFPAHHPDPSEEKNLIQLKQAVRDHQCDLGVAFDGDGDRLGVVDHQGRVVWGDQLLMLLSRDVLSTSPGATIIADVKASQLLFDEITRLGGKPLMWRTGHSFIKAKMKEIGAAFAGEMSGHIFFKDRYFGYDDGLYAAVRLLNFIALQTETLASLVDALPSALGTQEMKLDTTEAEKFPLIAEVQKLLTQEAVPFTAIDGVRVTLPNGWWLLRASNTQAVLVARCEANTPDDLKAMEQMLHDTLNRARKNLQG